MLVKMFPENGAVVPEIRFKGFTEDWEEKELKIIASDISDGNWIESNHVFDEGEYRIIQTGNLGVGEYIDKPKSAKYFNQKDFEEVRGNEIFPGDLLISRLAEPAGRTIILPSIGYRMVTSVDVTVIRPNSNSFDSTFLMTQLNTTNILNVVNENVSGTSHRRISRRNLEKTTLIVPILKEQQKLGQYFKNLDNQIALHQTQLDKLNNIKKACFNKMFVAQD
jgi:type I restriction enzyme S subunit